MCVSTHVGQKTALDPLELEIQVVVSHLTWILGTKMEFSIGAVGFFMAPYEFPDLYDYLK